MRLYNPNQLHMISRFVCVWVCRCLAEMSPQVFLLVQGEGVCVLVLKPVFLPSTHTRPVTNQKEVDVGQCHINHRVAEIPILQYPLRRL